MKKQEVIERLCILVSKVGEEVFEDGLAHDCFCGVNMFSLNEDSIVVSEEIIQFIETAVEQHIKKYLNDIK
jgi:hypothetical protein